MIGNRNPDRTIVGWITGVAGIGLLLFFVLHFGDLRAFGLMLRHAQPDWLALALLLQASTYLSVSLGWRAVLARAAARPPLRRLAAIAISKLFADQVIPAAGMGGDVLLVERLMELGVARGTAVAALLVSMIGYYAVYAALALLMLSLLWLVGKATLAMTAFVGLFLLVALALPTGALWLRRRGSHSLSPMLARIPLIRTLLPIIGEAPRALISNPRLIATVAGLNGLVFLADAGTMMACLRALGQHTGYEPCFIAVIAASMVVTLGPVPMGLGTFEAGATGMLSLLGITTPAALAATLMFRVFTLWLPLLPGLFSMRGTVHAATWSHKQTAE